MATQPTAESAIDVIQQGYAALMAQRATVDDYKTAQMRTMTESGWYEPSHTESIKVAVDFMRKRSKT